MAILIENGEVYAPGPLGRRSLLLINDKIITVAEPGGIDRRALDRLGIECEVIDATGCCVTPGLIDPHEHLLRGGSGEEGYATQTPEIFLREIALAGITTVVGCLGVDTSMKTLPGLLAKAKALREESLTAFIWTGGYNVPPTTLTGTIRDDLLFITETIGADEVAIADARSTDPTPHELARLASDAYIGGMLGNKSGLTHFHVGDRPERLAPLRRVDFTLSDKHQLYGRYAIEPRGLFEGSFGASPFAGFDAGAGQRNHSAVINWTWTRSPRWLSNGKLAYTRYNLIRGLGAAGGAAPRLLLTSAPANIGSFNVILPGFAPSGTGLLFTGPENILQASQDFSTSFRGHQITFSGSYFRAQDNRQFGAFQNAATTLGAGISQGLNNLVAGQLSTFQTAINPQGALPGGTITLPVASPAFSSSTRANDFALNFNDVWRAHPRLTFNVGLRYDYFGAVRPRGGRRFSGFTTGQTGTNIFEQIASGSLTFGDQNSGGSNSEATYEQEWGNIGPRLGFAYDVFGNGRVALRGGYGLTYQGPRNNPLTSAVFNPSSAGIATFIAGTGGVGTLPITTNNFGPLGGTTGTVALPLLSVSGVQNFELQTAHTHLWSLALESEFLPNTVASVQYLGAAGRDLYGLANVNRLGSGQVFNFGASAASRLNPGLGSIFLLNNAGRSNYHAMQAEATTSAFRSVGLQLSARYRYSHALDNQSTLFSGGLNGLGRGFSNPFDPGQDYGSSDCDIRHRFVGSFNWEVPFERLRGGFAKQVFGGWS